MRQLLEHLEQPNPECASCEGKGLFGLIDLCCPLCWNYHHQTGSQTTGREKLILITSILGKALHARDQCPDCGGSGWQYTDVDGESEKEPCYYCVPPVEAALRVFAKEIAGATEEALWLSGEKSMDDLLEEVLGV